MSTDSQADGWFGWFRRLWPRKDPELLRRKWLMEHGRIVEGIVLDMVQDGQSVAVKSISHGRPCSVSYRYQVSGVTYESNQVLDADQMSNIKGYLVGNHVSVRYDPRRPANAMVV